MPAPPTQQQWPIPGVSYIAGYPTPQQKDFFVYVYVDTSVAVPKLPDYGTPHPDNVRFKDHFLSLARPDEEQGRGWWIYIYTKKLEPQDDDNFNVSAPYGPADFPRIERDYILLRSDWLTDGPLALGTADPQVDVEGNPVFPGATLVESDQLVQQTGDPRIDSLFVKVRRVFEHIPDLSDNDDATAAHGFGYLIQYPYGRTAWPRVTWRIPNTSQTAGTPLTDTCPIPSFTTATFGNTTSLTGAATNGTTTVTAASTANLVPGAVIGGTDIPTGATVISITSPTAFVISAAATGTHTGLTLTVGNYVKLLDQSYENERGEIVALTRIYEPVYGPLIPESDLDQATFTAVRTTKQIVAQSAVPATAALLTAEMQAAGDGVTVEYKPMGTDGLRSVRIVSSADVGDLDWMLHPDGSKDIITYGTHVYSYWPDVLIGVTLIRQESASMSASISMAAQIEPSYKGPCFARFTERYTSDPADSGYIAALPDVHTWFERAETVVAGFASVNLLGNPISDSRTWTIPATIHGDVPVYLQGSSTFYDSGYYTTGFNATPYPALPAPGVWTCVELGEPQRVAHRLWRQRFIEVQYPEAPGP